MTALISDAPQLRPCAFAGPEYLLPILANVSAQLITSPLSAAGIHCVFIHTWMALFPGVASCEAYISISNTVFLEPHRPSYRKPYLVLRLRHGNHDNRKRVFEWPSNHSRHPEIPLLCGRPADHREILQ